MFVQCPRLIIIHHLSWGRTFTNALCFCFKNEFLHSVAPWILNTRHSDRCKRHNNAQDNKVADTFRSKKIENVRAFQVKGQTVQAEAGGRWAGQRAVCCRLGKEAGSRLHRTCGHIAETGFHLKCNGKTLAGFMLWRDMVWFIFRRLPQWLCAKGFRNAVLPPPPTRSKFPQSLLFSLFGHCHCTLSWSLLTLPVSLLKDLWCSLFSNTV